MMFLSTLMIDLGENPDKPRPGRRWLENVYHVHQRLAMAFPTEMQRENDPLFVRPFDPVGFRREKFLFRIDHSIEEGCPRAIIVVQSQAEPQWDYAFRNVKEEFLAAEPAVRNVEHQIETGTCHRFRILMNLSKKSTEHRKELARVDAKGRPRSQGKRVSFTWEKGRDPGEAIGEWFGEKGATRGFELRSCFLLRLGWVAGYKPLKAASGSSASEGQRMRFRSALLEGTLVVTDAEKFRETVRSGIGAGKSFGFGLLSVTPT